MDAKANNEEGVFLAKYDRDYNQTVIFNDDGHTAYAYLAEGEQLEECVGDVWLYNTTETPQAPEWTDASRAPFANPAEYVVAERVRPAKTPQEVSFKWVREPAQRVFCAVFVRGELFAVLTKDAKPGWSRNAKRNSPVALVLTEEIRRIVLNGQ